MFGGPEYKIIYWITEHRKIKRAVFKKPNPRDGLF